MKIIERLYQYIKFKGIKPTRFEKNIGLSNGYLGTQLKRNADLGESILVKIIDNSLDLSPEWLITGKGEMIKNDVVTIDSNDNLVAILRERLELKEDKIEYLQRELDKKDEKYFNLFEAINSLAELIAHNKKIDKNEIFEQIKKLVA